LSFTGALEVVVGAARCREQPLSACGGGGLVVVLTGHANEARQALRAVGLRVRRQAVVALLPPREDVCGLPVGHMVKGSSGNFRYFSRSVSRAAAGTSSSSSELSSIGREKMSAKEDNIEHIGLIGVNSWASKKLKA